MKCRRCKCFRLRLGACAMIWLSIFLTGNKTKWCEILQTQINQIISKMTKDIKKVPLQLIFRINYKYQFQMLAGRRGGRTRALRIPYQWKIMPLKVASQFPKEPWHLNHSPRPTLMGTNRLRISSWLQLNRRSSRRRKSQVRTRMEIRYSLIRIHLFLRMSLFGRRGIQKYRIYRLVRISRIFLIRIWTI